MGRAGAGAAEPAAAVRTAENQPGESLLQARSPLPIINKQKVPSYDANVEVSPSTASLPITTLFGDTGFARLRPPNSRAADQRGAASASHLRGAAQ
jgi:hypothetical protein